ncbi:MAG: hypothetical protein V3R90_15355 [Limibaculum sp.]
MERNIQNAVLDSGGFLDRRHRNRHAVPRRHVFANEIGIMAAICQEHPERPRQPRP